MGKPDLYAISPHGTNQNKVTIEVEKANKYKSYDDLMKLWLYQRNKMAAFGVLICPVNYPNRNTTPNPYLYAQRALRLLKNTAEVPARHIETIALIGFQQSVKFEGEWTTWDSRRCRRLKP